MLAGERTSALQLNLTMRIDEGHSRCYMVNSSPYPSGAGPSRTQRESIQRVERHLAAKARGIQGVAKRSGGLPSRNSCCRPLFVLQASSERRLHADLTVLGIGFEVAALAACGEADCFVLGDASRVAPPQEPTEEQVEDPGQPLSVLPEVPGFARAQGVSSPPPTLWVDSENFDVRRLRTSEGVRVEFGPYVDFGTLRAPSWLQIEEPGEKRVRLDIQKVRRVTLPESEMRADWLTSRQPLQTELPVSPPSPVSGFQEPDIR